MILALSLGVLIAVHTWMVWDITHRLIDMLEAPNDADSLTPLHPVSGEQCVSVTALRRQSAIESE